MNITFKVAILESGLSQRKLARQAKINESIISLAVRGRYLLDEEQKSQISKVLRRPISQIFGG